MGKNIWQELQKPIMVLAPMADVTDSAFRQVIAKYGHPDLFYTEFVSADGLASERGRPKLLRDLYYTPVEQPIIAQIFSSQPENIFTAAKLCAELGFAGVDINMGCPDKTIEKQYAGAALLKNPILAKEIILAAKKGVDNKIPISVKTRVGYNKVELEDWAEHLLETKPTAITFHLRTRKEMSKVPAQWDLIRIPLAMAKGTETLILGNGDVPDLADAEAKVEKYGVDGVMLGRAIFGNPFLFSKKENITLREKLEALVEHTNLFWELYGPTATNQKLFNGHTKNFSIMKKHFKAYVAGFPGANELRDKLMSAENPEEVEKIIL